MRATLSLLVERSSLYRAFAGAALRYWFAVFPWTCLELRRWRRRAAQIVDPALRQLALDALSKRGNMEGAAAFAAFVPRKRRRDVVRALVAFQAIYNHADMLAEQPSADPVGYARRGHEALLLALTLGGKLDDRDRSSSDPDNIPVVPADRRDDGGYVAALVTACRAAVVQLPSWESVASPARRAAEHIVDFQSLSLGPRKQLESWSRALPAADGKFEWWEMAAAAGSSLAVHALIAAAATTALPERDVMAISAAYFPCIGALHSLLDSLVDEAEDTATGQLRLLDCYPSRPQAAVRLQRLLSASLDAAGELSRGKNHELLVTAMACSYLAAPEALEVDVQAVARNVRGALGPLAVPILLVFKLHRLGGRSAAAQTAFGVAREPMPSTGVDPETRSADARAA